MNTPTKPAIPRYTHEPIIIRVTRRRLGGGCMLFEVPAWGWIVWRESRKAAA